MLKLKTSIIIKALSIFLFSVAIPIYGQTTKVIESSYKNGQPKEIHLYLEEKNRIDLVKKSEYYENGQKARVQHYKHGLKNGRFVEWRKDGTRIEEGDYENGDKNGHWIYWSKEGRKIKEGKYVEGQKDGTWTKYTQSGNVLWTKQYEYGLEVD